MPTARKCLLALLRLQFAPLVQGAIGDPQRAICVILLPLLCTSRTASSLNSFVNVRCSFGILPLPFCGGVYSNFPSSTKPGPAHFCNTTNYVATSTISFDVRQFCCEINS